MKILEVRDGFLKFEADDSIFLSGFILICDDKKNYVAQIIKLDANKIAHAKCLFTFDGTLQPYDASTPSLTSTIKEFTFDILNNTINAKEPMIIGKTPNKNIDIIVDSSFFKNKCIASIDNKNTNNTLVRTLVKQFNNIGKKVVIIDSLGVLNAKKIIAGKDFKLPLNTSTLEFMYKECLNDATAESKAITIDIFKELSEYSQTVPFVPFGTLKSIVDDMVDKSHIFKLLVLKNKLAKFDRLGYFATEKSQVENFDKVFDLSCSIIDLSKIDTDFQNKYLAYIYEKIDNNKDIQVILELSNTVSKINLKNIMLNNNVATTFITHSKFKYLNDIKNMFDNFVIEPSFTNNQIFKVYSSFLKLMKPNSYLIAGEGVNYIPIISEVKYIENIIPVVNNKEIGVQKNLEVNNNEENTVPESITTTSIEEEQNTDEVENNDEDKIEIKEIDEVQNNLTPISNNNNNLQLIEESSEQLVDNKDSEITENIKFSEPEKEIETPVISNEEIIDNIDKKSEAVISALANETLSQPKEMFTTDDDADEDDINDELLNDENILQDKDDLETVLETDSSNDIELTEEINNSDSFITEKEEVEEQNENVEELSFESIENDTNQELTGENDINELLLDDNNDMDIEESLDFSPEEINENEIVEQIPMTDEFENDYNISEELLEISDSENKDEELQENFLDINNSDEEENELQQEFVESEQEDIPENDSEIEIPEEMYIGLENDDSNEILEEDFSSTNTEILEESNNDIMPLNDDDSNFEEIVELDPTDTNADDIIVDLTEEEPLSDDVDEQIVKDVDKVFTTRKDDEISDSDLDFIDELNNDDNEVELLQEVSDSDTSTLDELIEEDNDGVLEELKEVSDSDKNDKFDNNDEILETKSSSTPIVPVYDAEIPEEDIVMSDPIQQGDTVIHAKYGTGIVEKMIKYGNKSLYSINFDNIGRRLLDPTLTEIKKA